jgi:hypothetical protein
MASWALDVEPAYGAVICDQPAEGKIVLGPPQVLEDGHPCDYTCVSCDKYW